MRSFKEITPENSSSRRKFVWGMGILSLFTALSAAIKTPFSTKKNAIVCKSNGERKTTKMLTEDGRLVEVDEALVFGAGKKITSIELQNWIKNN